MRHRKAGRKLNRSWEHRKAMFRNMARSLVVHESIRTTEARAKEMRKVADNLVTLAVKGDLHAKRQAYKVLNDHALVKRLFDEIGPRFAGVPGGYTRVVKLGNPRAGDAAPMALIEFSIRAGEQAETKDKPKKAAKKAAPKAEKKAKKAEPKAEEAPAEEAKAEEAPAEEIKAEEAPAEEVKAEEAPAEEAKAEEAPAEEAPAAETEEKPEDKPEEKA